MPKLGIVSMRNEDGTQYLVNVEGNFCWTPDRREATPVPREVAISIESTQVESRRNDCPDNGFLGIYNLKFREI